MKIGRVVFSFCLLLAGLLAICQPSAVLAQEESLTITTTDLADGTVGEAYSATLEATGGTTPYTWSISDGSLPVGLSLNPATGEISGTPTKAIVAADFTVKVTAGENQAQETTKYLTITISPTPTVDIKATYPAIEGIAGATFQFEVDFNYIGKLGGEARSFELVLTTPEGWDAYMTPQYQKDTRIRDITLTPGYAAGSKINVYIIAPVWPLPDPGEYKITLEAISGEIKGTTELTAVVTAKYVMNLASTTERLNTTATAGRDNFFTIEVDNLGTAAIDEINFSTTKPSGWTVDFNPEKIESLPAIDYRTVEVNIKPTAETVAGDYSITITASGKQISESIDIRVTVETPTIWGWVGVVIIALVVVGMAYIFIRFSRR